MNKTFDKNVTFFKFKINQIVAGRRYLRKYLRGEDNCEVTYNSSQRDSKKVKRREEVIKESISQASNIPSDNVHSLPRQVINQRQKYLEDIRVRSSNRLSASNQPQVSIISNFFWNYICNKTSGMIRNVALNFSNFRLYFLPVYPEQLVLNTRAKSLILSQNHIRSVLN